MLAPQRLAVATLMLVSLLVGCETTQSGTPGPRSLSGTDICSPEYESLLPANWTFISKTALSSTDVYQCVMFYSFDHAKGNSKNVPVSGMVYRVDHNRPIDIHAYPLSLPGGLYLGVHQVSVRMADVLSGSPEPELVVEDTNEYGAIVEASIFNWQEGNKSEESVYRSRGWFTGEGGVRIDRDRATVYAPRMGTRSRLADRKVYLPRENKSYYPKQGDKPEDTSRLVDPLTVDLVSLDMPSDLAEAEYPEKLLLGFYASLPSKGSDTLKGWMTSEAWKLFSDGNSQVFGCLVDSQLSQVFVQNLDLSQAAGIPLHLENENKVITNTVTVTALCRLNANGKQTDKKSLVTWPVRWEKGIGRWELCKPTVKP